MPKWSQNDPTSAKKEGRKMGEKSKGSKTGFMRKTGRPATLEAGAIGAVAGHHDLMLIATLDRGG